jgi:hypothetical protein
MKESQTRRRDRPAHERSVTSSSASGYRVGAFFRSDNERRMDTHESSPTFADTFFSHVARWPVIFKLQSQLQPIAATLSVWSGVEISLVRGLE